MMCGVGDVGSAAALGRMIRLVAINQCTCIRPHFPQINAHTFTAWAISSPVYTVYTALLGKSVPEGAATHVFLAVAPEVKDVNGKYFVDCREEPYWVSKCTAFGSRHGRGLVDW